MKNIVDSIINDYLCENEVIINEYIDRNMVSLKDYLTMSEEGRKSMLAHEYYYFFDDFIKDEGVDFDYNDVEGIIDGDIELITWLENNNNELFKQFNDWLYNSIMQGDLNINISDYPAWHFFDDDVEIIKNQWLIHFTSDADNIVYEGFKYGVDDMTRLGLTTHIGDIEKKYGGYNFAYTIEDFYKYAFFNPSKTKLKYGDEAVLFRASGIKVWHNSDDEPQVIFYGNTANNIIAITRGEYAQYAISNKNGKILIENDDLKVVVDWFVNNYHQYRKQF